MDLIWQRLITARREFGDMYIDMNCVGLYSFEEKERGRES